MYVERRRGNEQAEKEKYIWKDVDYVGFHGSGNIFDGAYFIGSNSSVQIYEER
jgi:hypothetical protein